MNKNPLLTLAVLVAFGGASVARADESGTTLEEIVITATKRESTVQNTPISVTAISPTRD